MQFGVSRRYLCIDCSDVGGCKACTIGVVDALRKCLQRFVEQALLCVLDDQALQLRKHAFNQHPRQHNTALDAELHINDGLVHPDDKAIHAF